jgi:hypothetical protein
MAQHPDHFFDRLTAQNTVVPTFQNGIRARKTIHSMVARYQHRVGHPIPTEAAFPIKLVMVKFIIFGQGNQVR